MATWLVVTFISPDRPGLVEGMADVVRAHGGNWEQSKLAVLAGRFAGILEVTVADERADALERALRGRGGPDFVVHVDRGSDAPDATGTRLTIRLTGGDHEGIVHDVSRVIRAAGLNIEELDTEVVAAPMAGGVLFEATLEVTGPADLDRDAVRAALERLADDLMVEIEVADR